MLRERQDEFIEVIATLDNWGDRFKFLWDCSESLSPECPESLKNYRIANCQSRTYFLAGNNQDTIVVRGWSNSPVMGGIIYLMQDIFNGVPISELKETNIDFHVKSDLINNLTPMRRAALEEIINRIIVLSPKDI